MKNIIPYVKIKMEEDENLFILFDILIFLLGLEAQSNTKPKSRPKNRFPLLFNKGICIKHIKNIQHLKFKHFFKSFLINKYIFPVNEFLT